MLRLTGVGRSWSVRAGVQLGCRTTPDRKSVVKSHYPTMKPVVLALQRGGDKALS